MFTDTDQSSQQNIIQREPIPQIKDGSHAQYSINEACNTIKDYIGVSFLPEWFTCYQSRLNHNSNNGLRSVELGNLETIYKEIFGNDSTDKRSQLIKLAVCGIESLRLQGIKIELPPIKESTDQKVEWFIRINDSFFEGALEMQFWAHRPTEFSQGNFSQTDIYGNSLAKLIVTRCHCGQLDLLRIWLLKTTLIFSLAPPKESFRLIMKIPLVKACKNIKLWLNHT